MTRMTVVGGGPVDSGCGGAVVDLAEYRARRRRWADRDLFELAEVPPPPVSEEEARELLRLFAPVREHELRLVMQDDCDR